ncbi:MAG TPA: hypothetical protein DCQ76_04215 [Ruminococcaceae bacterium]|nr:hypothetical protein [Oscillospiraceae bacterium]
MSKTKVKNKKETKFSLFLKNNKYILIAALIAFAVMQLVYFCFSLIPYGDMTILRMDLYHQYGPLFAELYDRITSGESLIYSWNSGLGSSFLGNFYNYLSSPVTILILFFGHKNIPEAIAAMIAVKAMLSAGSFTYYIKKSLGRHDPTSAAFGILYAFCGYFVAYYWNLMWLDAMVLFPIILLGIERIINKGKPALYCVSLALMFFANYYMAYMICIFAVLYFLTYYFANYSIEQKFDRTLSKKAPLTKRLSNSLFWSSGVKFAFYSIVAVLLAAFVVVPLISILSDSSATSSGAPTEYKKYFSTFDFLANHLASSEPTIRSSGSDVLPNVYCGVLTLLLVPLFLFCKKIKAREKISYVCLLGVLYLSFNINYLNFVWHGFHFPNDLPYRFSFMYSFILLVMAYKALIHIKDFSGKEILASGLGFALFLVLVEKITSKNIGDMSLGLSIIFGVGYVLILRLLKDKKFQASAVSILLLCTVTSEIALGNTNHYSMNQNKTNYTSDYDDFKTLKKELDDYDGNGFYRMELTSLRTRMDPCWYDYNGVSVFSSMAYESVSNMQQELGMFGNYINSYTYNPQTPVYNAMFGLKYLVDNCGYYLNDELYSSLMQNGKFTAYKNNYALPIAFAVNNGVASWSSKDAINPFEAQNSWFENATGISNVLTQVNINDVTYSNLNAFSDMQLSAGILAYNKKTSGASASFTAEIVPQSTANVYVYVKSSVSDNATITADGFSKTFDADDGYIIDLGERTPDDTIYVDVPIKSSAADSGTLSFYVYSLDMDKFKEGYEKLSGSGELKITSYNDTEIFGDITVNDGEMVYTSIPYDTNWEVYVDGVKVKSKDIVKISDSLLGFYTDPGEHEIYFRYYSYGLKNGAIISIITIIIATVLIIMKRRGLLFYKKKKQDKWLMLRSEKAPITENVYKEISVSSAQSAEPVRQAADEEPSVQETESSDEKKEVREDDSDTAPHEDNE